MPLPIDDDHAPLYSVGQVASMLDVQQAFLRRLDEHEVVRPGRSAGGQRRYTRNEIGRLQYVIALIAEGMSLTAVRRVLELEGRIHELEARHRADRRRISELQARLDSA